MIDSYDFSEQMEIGATGVALAIELLADNYGWAHSVEDQRWMQQHGVDVLVNRLGYVEVKTDMHTTKNFFFELSVEGGPGGLDKSAADYFAFLFPNEGKMFLIKRPDLMYWLRDRMFYYLECVPGSFKTVESNQGDRTWEVRGLVVSWTEIVGVLDVITVTFADLSDGSAALWEEEE